MDFEEKIDALRMNLELAFHDIEALRDGMQEIRESMRVGMQEVRESMQELRGVSQIQNESIRELRLASERQNDNIRELRMLAESQYDNVQSLIKSTGDLVAIADSHERRITAIEKRN